MNQQMYTTAELQAMSAEELRTAQANGFVKPTQSQDHAVVIPSRPSPPQNPYAVTAWGESEYDFQVPSGQLCRMKKLQPQDLVGTDILDLITMLPGHVDDLVKQSTGQPPVQVVSELKEQLPKLIEVLDKLLPIVVVQPKVMPDDTPEDERPVGSVLVSDIELADRIAIMERALQGVAKMSNFRKEP